MQYLGVNYSRGQMKIQEMAFVLMAIFIFFGMVFVVYTSLKYSELSNQAEDVKTQEAKEISAKIASWPEFAFTTKNQPYCPNCIDMQKVVVMKEKGIYDKLVDVQYLRIVRVYPAGEGTCRRDNYDKCSDLEVVNNMKNATDPVTKQVIGAKETAYVSLCYTKPEKDQFYIKCDVGRIEVIKESLQ